MSKYFIIDCNNGVFEKSFTSLINNSIKISPRVLFNCTSISDSFLAIGCNTGNVYLFYIENEKFKYFTTILSNDSSVDNLEFSPSKSYLIYSNVKFQIFIYKLNFITETANLIRQIDSMHNSSIHSFLWDEENSRIFCGFKNATIDAFFIPQQTKDIFYFPSDNIIKSEKQFLIQMDFIKDIMLVSTNEKVVLLNLLSKFSILIGTKPRSGSYGACFWLGEAKILKVIAARPNHRIWIADIDGTVEETQQYKLPVDSFKYKLQESDDDFQGSGQFSWLSPVKNNLIFAGDVRLIFLIDLVLKSCLVTINCGNNLTKTIYSNYGVAILNSLKEIRYITISTLKNALIEIINGNIDFKYAIDLILSLKADSYYKNDENLIRKIWNTLPPNLISSIVEKAAELEYRFTEVNQLQVNITDDPEYQKIFYLNGRECFSPTRNSNADSTEITAESSNDLSIDSSNSQNLNKTRTKKLHLANKIKNATKIIFETTTKIMSQIDISGSQNSDINLLGLTSYSDSYDHIDKGNEISLKQSSIDIISENSGDSINVMELEANVFIAWERMKNLSNNDDTNAQNDFLDSLSNFCESWLIINFKNWRNLFKLELHIRNLSATFPNFSLKSIENQSDRIIQDNFIEDEKRNYLYQNSWSCTIKPSEWMKPLVISDKIIPMISTILSCCFSYGIFTYFPYLIQEIHNLMNIDNFNSLENTNNSLSDLFGDENNKSIQTNYVSDIIETETYDTSYRFPDLLNILNNEIWSDESNHFWIKSMLMLFHSATNLTELRVWLRSCLSQRVWITIVDCLIEIHSSIFNHGKYHIHSAKSQIELDEILFNGLYLNNITSLLCTDKIFQCMKNRGNINWKIIIESENLNCREVMHLSIKYNFDMTSYIVNLFDFIKFSSKFSSKNHLIELLYSEEDVLISFVYTLLNNCISEKEKSQTCSCGMILTYSNSNLPGNIYQIVIEILKWGSDHNVFKSNTKLLDLMTNISINMGFHQGYIELLVGICDVKKLIQIALQTSNFQVLERIKDCVFISKHCIQQAIECLILLHRKYHFDHCICCNRIIENRSTDLQPVLFKDIGELIFTKLIDKNNHQEIHHNIIKMLNKNEVDQVKEYLITSIYNIINSRKMTVRNQMFNFITTEINQVEESSKLTEMFLNIYGMSYSELCGENWGKILSQNMYCDICGAILIDKILTSNEVNIVSFSCSHIFHRKCLQEIGCDYICFIC